MISLGRVPSQETVDLSIKETGYALDALKASGESLELRLKEKKRMFVLIVDGGKPFRRAKHHLADSNFRDFYMLESGIERMLKLYFFETERGFNKEHMILASWIWNMGQKTSHQERDYHIVETDQEGVYYLTPKRLD